jgi:sulfopyruvate decarboxylase TPP-binding subunit
LLTGAEAAETLAGAGFTDVVWLPDSLLGTWEAAIEAEPRLRLRRFCREGEAWVLAAGLHLGGRRPVVVMQSTGLFESGDALRNVFFDLRIPLYALIGYRSLMIDGSPDSAKRYLEPVLAAWGLPTMMLPVEGGAAALAADLRAWRQAPRPRVALVPEGRG